MRVLALVALVALTADARPGRFERTNSRTPQGRSDRGFLGDSYAFLEFAPASGAGMGTVCACTTPTGARGEAMTFTRGSSATCTKTPTGGLATSGIADGDMVTCSSNQPRVEYDSAGTPGLLVESARSNICLRSEELTNAVWFTAGTGVAAPTATPNYAVAPDGAQTAERFEFPATTAAQQSLLYQTVTALGSAGTATLYVKGTSGSGTIDILTTAPNTCSTCNYNATTWTRCVAPASSGVSQIYIGNIGTTCGNARSANDVLVWGVQIETGAYATSYMPTTAAPANRLVEAASFTLSAAIGPAFSMAASVVWPSSSVGAVTVAQLGTAAPNLASIGRNTNTAGAFTINATSTTPAVSAIGTAGQRIALADDGTNESAFWESSSVAAPNGDMSAGSTAFSLGASDGVTSRVCIDPSPSRCL